MLVFQNYGENRNNNVWINVIGSSNERYAHTVTCGVRDENHHSLTVRSSTKVKVDEWMHVACVFKRDDVDVAPGSEDGYEDEELMMYINGELEDYSHGLLEGLRTGGGAPILLGAHGWISDTDANCNFGAQGGADCRRESFSNRFVGRITEFKYWNVPLSQYEIQLGMFQEPDTLDEHLMAYASFKDPSPWRTTEDTSAQHDIQLMTHGSDGAVIELDADAPLNGRSAKTVAKVVGECSVASSNTKSATACPQRLSAYPAGRVEIFHPRVGWGTVCGHYYWDGNGAADVVCKDLGYETGQMYTYGVTRSLGVTNDFLPIVAGFRTCQGNEANILECPTHGSPTDPDCRYGCDSSCTHSLDQGVTCQSSDRHLGQIRSDIQQCPQSDRFSSFTNGMSRDVSQPIRFGCIEYQTAQCSFDSRASDGKPAATLLQATRAFAICAETSEAPGYCHGLLGSAAKLSNQDVCAFPSGCSGNVVAVLQDGGCFTQTGHGFGARPVYRVLISSFEENAFAQTATTTVLATVASWAATQSRATIALARSTTSASTVRLSRIIWADAPVLLLTRWPPSAVRVPFAINQEGRYSFRLHADYGRGGYFGVDGADHTGAGMWGHGQTEVQSLAVGDHEFEALGFEDCCDGHSELEVHLACDSESAPWRVVETTVRDGVAARAPPPTHRACLVALGD